MLPLRVVLDTSVLISKLIYAPGSTWLVQAWQNGALIPLVTEETMFELERVLYRAKFHLAAKDVAARIAEYYPWCQIYSEDATIPVPECRDPNDRKFLQLALQAQADALVTEDQDLLRFCNILLGNCAIFSYSWLGFTQQNVTERGFCGR